MSINRPPPKLAAFTLLELIIVIVLVAIVSVYIITRSDSSSSYQLDTIVEQIISSARLSQQLSMNDNTRTFALLIQSNSINLTADGSPFAVGNISFPINFGSQVTLSPNGSISFNSLGETTATTLNVQLNQTIQICFRSSGYIERC
ncbi:prepilin-type N-terminal cleavage/methylation domain-containing protein [Aliikangiella maris]|uniref:Prepilin-type N-terminal cleavage/methylation domain-containing protein n=2 Tax=Aliikangiella maris TaxID=3162458 RepID=A0ABV3MQD2_9GAMM